MNDDVMDERFDEYLDLVLRGRAPSPIEFLAAHGIADDEFCGRFLALARDLPTRRLSDPTCDSLTANVPPAVFGPFRIVELLGSGGQGVVYLAEDSRLSRRVALKVLRFVDVTIDPASTPMVARLRREAELTSRLEHPGICPVYELGTVERAHYIAMRFVEGITLASWIATMRRVREGESKSEVRGLPDPRDSVSATHEVVAYFEKAARALHAAHEAGVVHRDVKPGNLMVTPSGEPVVLDFGLARDTTGDTPPLTVTGQVHGTPAYMSPEQLDETPREIDRRTDVFSLGVTLFESLTLQHPFPAATRDELNRAIRDRNVPSPRRLNRRIPESVCVVIARAVDREPLRRYATLAEFADDLRRARDGEPIVARPASIAWRITRFARRNARGVLATIASLVVLSVAIRYAIRFERVAAAREHLAAARDRVASDPDLAIHLALAARDEITRLEINEVLDRALASRREVRRIDTGSPGVAWCAPTTTESGREPDIVAMLTDARVRAWDPSNRVAFESPLGVARAVLAPSGGVLAWSDESGRIEVVATSDWTVLRLVNSSPGCALAFSADSRTLLVGTLEQEIITLDLEDGAEVSRSRVGRIPGAMCTARADEPIAFSSNSPALGAWVISGGVTTASFETTRGSLAHRGDPFCKLSPDGRHLLVQTYRGVAQIVALSGRETPVVLVGSGDADECATFDSTGKRVLIAGSRNDASIYSTTTGEKVAWNVGLRGERITTAAFSADDARVVTGGASGSVRVDDFSTGSFHDLVRHEKFVTSARFLDRDRLLTSGGIGDGSIRIFDLRDTRRGHTIDTGNPTIESFALHPASEWLAVCSSEPGRIDIYDLRDRAHPSIALDAASFAVPRVVYSRCGRYVFAAIRNQDATGGVLVLDTDRIETLDARVDGDSGAAKPVESRMIASPSPVWDVAMSFDGALLATASEDGIVRVFEVRAILGDDETKPERAVSLSPREIRGEGRGLRAVRFAPGDSRLLTVSEFAGVEVFDAEGERILHLADCGRIPTDACFDRSGTRIAVVGRDPYTRVYRVEDGGLLLEIQHAGASEARHVAISPDDSWIATGVDAEVWVHRLADGKPVRRITGNRTAIRGVMFTEDAEGTWLAWGAEHSWTSRLADPLDEAQRSSLRVLTAAERERFEIAPER